LHRQSQHLAELVLGLGLRAGVGLLPGCHDHHMGTTEANLKALGADPVSIPGCVLPYQPRNEPGDGGSSVSGIGDRHGNFT
jgi:hypothetical protein